MIRISRNGQEPIVDVDQVEAIKPAIRLSEMADSTWMRSAPLRCRVGTLPGFGVS